MKNRLEKLLELVDWVYYLYCEDSLRGRIVTQIWDIADEEGLDIRELLIDAIEQDVLKKSMLNERVKLI